MQMQSRVRARVRPPLPSDEHEVRARYGERVAAVTAKKTDGSFSTARLSLTPCPGPNIKEEP